MTEQESCVVARFPRLEVSFTEESSCNISTERNLRTSYQATLRSLEDLFASSAELDPTTGEPVNQTHSSFLQKAIQHSDEGEHSLALTAPIRYGAALSSAVQEILAAPTSRLTRFHIQQRIQKIKETDLRTLRSLAKRPGSTVREKLAGSARLLAVNRKWDLDRVENRVLLRVIRELIPLLKTELDWGPTVDSYRANLCRRQECERLIRSFQDAATTSEIAGLRPLSRVQPNNVLLVDRRYRRVWKVWKWLNSRRDNHSRIWQAGPGTIISAILLLILGKLKAQRTTLIPEVFLTVLLNPSKDNGFGYPTLANQTNWLATGERDRSCILTFAPEGQFALNVQVYTLRGNELQKAELTNVISGWIDVDVDRVSAGRGLPIDWHIESVEGFTSVLQSYADLNGFTAAAGEFVKALPEFGTLETTAECEPVTRSSIDCTGHRLISSSISKDIPLVISVCSHSQNEFVGESARRVDPGAVFAGALIQSSLDLSTVTSDSSGRAARGLKRIIEAAYSTPRMLRSLVFASFDTADDAELALQRLASPAHCEECWIVWRSILVALAMRQRDLRFNDAFQQGDAVIVVDLDAKKPIPVCLTGRDFDRPVDRSEHDDWDGWCWERTSPGDIKSLNNPTSDEFERKLASKHIHTASPELDQNTLDNLVRSITTLDLLDDTTLPVWPLGSGTPDSRKWLRTGIDPLHRHQVAASFANDLWAWLRDLNSSEYMSEIRLRSKNRVSILLVGRVLEDPILLKQLHTAAEMSEPHSIWFGSVRDIVHGGEIFQDRLERGFPTYVDLLPDLYLEVVNTRGERRQIDLFHEERVAPGQRIERLIEEQVVLLAGKEYYSFPLFRKESDGTPLSFHARLQSSAFPLPCSISARICVGFRYARDTFTVQVVPSDASVCGPIEIQWTRGAANNIELNNDPPEFPSYMPWRVPPEVAGDFNRRVEEWIQKLENTFATASFPQECRRANADSDCALLLSKEIRGLERLTDKLRVDIHSLWLPLRERDHYPDELRRSMEKLRRAGCELVGISARSRNISRNVHTGRGIPPSLQQPIRRLIQTTLVLLASFRWDAPHGLLDAIMNAGLENGKKWRALAKAADSEPGGVSRLIALLVGEMFEAIEKENVHQIAYLEWALASVLWGDRNAVSALSDRIRDVADCCIRVLSKLADGWSRKGIAEDLFSEAAVILLALMRSRGTAHGECLRAGGELSKLASDALHRAKTALESVRTLRRPRIRLASELSPVGVYDDIISAIQGQRLIHVVSLEDEDETK